MRLLRAGDDDGLIKELWFVGWLAGTLVGAWLLWHWAGVMFSFCAVCAIRARRSHEVAG